MQKILLKEAEQYTKQNQRRRIWRKIVQAMACVVVFCTTYALILPAITMEKNPCDLEEHTHGESCYEKVVSDKVTMLMRRWVFMYTPQTVTTAKNGSSVARWTT